LSQISHYRSNNRTTYIHKGTNTHTHLHIFTTTTVYTHQ